MIAQLILSILLVGVMLYASTERRRFPVVSLLFVVVAGIGVYLVWFPAHATQLASWAGIGRGVDLVLYIWVCISLLAIFNLHLKLRIQLELITALVRKLALADAQNQKAANAVAPLQAEFRKGED